MSEGGETTPAADASPPCDGAASPVVARRARYGRPLAFYPARFQSLLSLAELPVRERALKGWIAEGRDATPPELPPFDQPRRLKDWWVRVKTNRPPDWVVALAALPASAPVSAPSIGEALSSPPSPDASSASTTPPAVASPSASVPSVGPLFDAAAAAPSPASAAPSSASVTSPSTAPVSVSFASASPGSGYLGALQRVREAEATAGRLYNTLLAAAAAPTCTPEDRTRLASEAEHARRAWDELINRLRPMEKDAAEILREAGVVWDRDAVIASVTMIHLTLHRSLVGHWRRIRSRIRLCATQPDEEALWLAELEKLFAALRANQFTRPAEFADEAPSAPAA